MAIKLPLQHLTQSVLAEDTVTCKFYSNSLMLCDFVSLWPPPTPLCLSLRGWINGSIPIQTQPAFISLNSALECWTQVGDLLFGQWNRTNIDGEKLAVKGLDFTTCEISTELSLPGSAPSSLLLLIEHFCSISSSLSVSTRIPRWGERLGRWRRCLGENRGQPTQIVPYQ